MLNDCAVEGTVVGGPAFISRGVVQGDKILKIDNHVVNAGLFNIYGGTNLLDYFVHGHICSSLEDKTL